MTDIDPYLKWLGIRDPQRPPHHYRLLGIDLFESDDEIITGAARRRISHIQSYADGEHSDRAAELISQLKKAARTLLSPDARLKYENKLRKLMPEPSTPVTPPPHSSAPMARPIIAPIAAPVVPVAPAKPVAPVAPTVPVVPTSPVAPVFANADQSGAAGSGNPAIQSRPKRKPKKNQTLFTMLGIMSGGLAAVVVAGFIIKSGWLDIADPTTTGSPEETVVANGNDSGSSPVVDRDRFNGQANRPLPNGGDESNELKRNAGNRAGSDLDSNSGNESTTTPVNSPGSGGGFAGVDPGVNPVADTGSNNGLLVESENEAPSNAGGFFDSGNGDGEFDLNPPSGSPDFNMPGNSNDPAQPAANSENIRAAVPDDKELAGSRQLIEELYSTAYDRSVAPAERIKVVQEMIRSADDTAELANVFTLLSEAATISSTLVEPKICLSAIEKLDSRFEVDYCELTDSLFSGMHRQTQTPVQLQQLSEVLTTLSLRGVRDGEYQYSVSMSNLVANVARKINPATLRFAQQLKNEIKDVEKLAERGRRAEQALQTSPDDKSHHEALGDLECLIINDFESGCYHWLRSGDAELIKIAKAEKQAVSGSEEDLKLAADAWFEAGSRKSGFRDYRMLARATEWYQLLLPRQSGLSAEITEKRIDEIENFLMDIPTSLAFKSDSENVTLQSIMNVQWNIAVKGGGSFTARFSGARVQITRDGKNASFLHSKSDQMFLASLAPKEDSTLLFRVRSADKIDYKKIDNATGATSEWGVGSRNR